MERAITGEIIYLDEMRRLNQEPGPFLGLGDMAIQGYQAEVAKYANGERPEIINEYEKYDPKPSEAVSSCTALANELLKLKEAGSTWTFVDISIEVRPEIILAKLQATPAGRILSAQDEQLAIPSDGEYHPILDIRKQNAKLVDVGLRIWGWDDDKYVFTNEKGEQFVYPQHALVYPSSEKSHTRQIELTFGYKEEKIGSFTESISLYINNNGSARMSSNIWAMVYAESGYEGHGGTSMRDITDHDIAAFGDLIAGILGDEPQTIAMKVNQQLKELTESAATPYARQAIQDLVKTTWPAQADYFLHRKLSDSDSSIAQQLRDKSTADTAVTAVNKLIDEWKAKRVG